MGPDFESVRDFVGRQVEVDGFEARLSDSEIHLEKEGDSFARLVPCDKPGMWRIEIFKNMEEWEILDFSGSLSDCLAFLSEHPRYLYWER